MTKIAATLGLAAALMTSGSVSASLIITGVVDGPRTGGTPKAIEFYATSAIADLAVYGVRTTNLAEGTGGGAEYTFPTGAVAAGTYITVASEATEFTSYFGFAPTYTNGVASINGDDGVVLYQNASVIDLYGEPTVDGTGTAWEYLDSYAYRKNGTGPDGSSFAAASWTYGGVDFLDSQTSTGVNGSDQKTVPFGTYQVPEPASLSLLTLAGIAALRRRRA